MDSWWTSKRLKEDERSSATKVDCGRKGGRTEEGSAVEVRQTNVWRTEIHVVIRKANMTVVRVESLEDDSTKAIR